MSFEEIGYLQDFPKFIENGDPLCSQVDPELFFPIDRLDSTMAYRENYADEQAAKAVCNECPYKLACLSFALERPDTQGIWGGTTHMDRRRMLRRLRSQRKAGLL
jgi:WhiB family redox-sensing transcriptional regulator